MKWYNLIKGDFMSEESKDFLNYISLKEVGMDDVITLLFLNYIDRYQKGTLYSDSDFLPQNLIRIYYSNITEPRFNSMQDNFKQEYIINESELEDAHSPIEREGLGIVYDYINSIKRQNLTIYQICNLNQLLFSKAPHPEYGGQFRTDARYLPNSGIELCEWRMIPGEIQKLYVVVETLMKRGDDLRLNRNPNGIIEYINECLKVKAKLIEIHPFGDGNGRTARAFLNILFKLANIPPVYVKLNEKSEYGKAMNNAILNHDFAELEKFYYYKICDSIIELDINKRITNPNNEDMIKKL